jgi:N-acetylneuraminic acid mutarotase
MWEFDPTTNNWNAKSNFPGVPRIYGQKAFVIGNEAYLIGGTSTSMNALPDCWKYNALTNKWDSIAPLPIPRNDACTFTLNNKGYVVSGTPNQSNLLNDCWEYNPTLNSWILKDSLPADPRKFATSFSINNMGYIVGGINHFGNPIDEVWSYNALTEKWVKKNNINTEGIYAALSTSINNTAFICMGRGIDNINFFKEIRSYNPDLDTWNTLTLFPKVPSIFGIAESINNKIYIGLGSNVLNNSIASFYELDPFGSVGILSDLSNTKQSFTIESPFSNTAKLFYKNVVKGKYDMNMFDMSGKLLSKKQIDLADNMNGELELLETEYFKNGLYFLIIKGNNYQQHVKILKAN